ncbi:UDP-glucose 4-epimerase GalE [Rhodoferax sp.]|uniref:UDP-glucose 4-epimerase GalE n=1 Tax=Rhodoferax sp. TaxID=50421 RepID=UPI0027554CD5|nr:UDP-glucose 4-epimerase GalE [Rhodoferax sp.]
MAEFDATSGRRVLVTGGAGYIGSHTCLELLQAGHHVTVLDNLCNSSLESLKRVESLAGRSLTFMQGDIRDFELLRRVLVGPNNECPAFDAVVHFAGLKAVGESVSQPLAYFDNNLSGTVCLLRAMTEAGVKTLVFSSSATVYGDPASVPISEDFPRSATNPYGRSKLVIEDMLADLYRSDPAWRIARLRYFNPVGAHVSGLIGEDPSGAPNNLMPYVSQVAIGRREYLQVFGGDYPTPDGTGVRDYIHVADLASGHLAAIRALWQADSQTGCLLTVNLGTGVGVSVLDLVKAFERASGRPVPYRIVARRAGDVAACYANPVLAQTLLGWRTQRNLADMCADAWRWQSRNPHGYRQAAATGGA